MQEINTLGLKLVKEFEGLRLVAYDDLAPNKVLKPGDAIKGTLTIGHGHTGPDVFIGQAITEEEAERLLRADLDTAENAVAELVEVPLNENQFSALVSFVYNVGSGNFLKSTLLKRLNRGEIDRAAEEFARWNKSKGQVLVGLTRRRAAEKALFLKPVQQTGATESPDDVLPSIDGKAASKIAAWVATTIGGAWAGAKEAGMGTWEAVAIVGVIAAAGVAAWLIWRKRK